MTDARDDMLDRAERSEQGSPSPARPAEAPIGELVAALAAAQGDLEPPAKDREIDMHGRPYRYATLDSIIRAIEAAFPKHGLAWTQDAATGVNEAGGYVVVRLTLFHVSGQRLAFSPFVIPCKADPHSIGSALTYARRYQLSSAFGIASEDDDDARAARDNADAPLEVAGSVDDATGKATEAQMKAVHALGARKGMSHDAIRDWAGPHLGIESLTELTRAGAAKLIEELGKLPDAEPAKPKAGAKPKANPSDPDYVGPAKAAS